MIRFVVDPSNVVRAIENIKKDISSPGFGYQNLKKPHREIIEANVKKRFEERRQKDASANVPETDHTLSKKIISLIDTELIPFNQASKEWIVGVGNLKKLMDPGNGLLLKSLGGNAFWLWQILEKGAGRHSISAVRGQNLRFFWFRNMVWFWGSSISHPGQRARNFFLTEMDALYQSDTLVAQKIYEGLVKILNRYSAR